MNDDRFSKYKTQFGLGKLARPLRFLKSALLNHRFERRSPLQLLPPELEDAVSSSEVVLPPRKHLVQPGTQSLTGLIALVSLAKSVDATTVFEIGTYRGVTSWSLARNLPGAVIHTLDISPAEDPALPLEGSDKHRAHPSRMLYESLPSPGRIVQHWCDSAKFDFGDWTGECDVVLIDGGHSRAYVESDTENALRMMSTRGAIVWDDYWRHAPGVSSVLDELRNDLELFRIADTRLVVHLTSEAKERMLRQLTKSATEAGP